VHEHHNIVLFEDLFLEQL